MKYFDWDEEKNQWLIQERNISFDYIKECIESGLVVANLGNHPSYEHQKVFLVLIEDYVYHVPYVEDDEKIFLKIAFPSKKTTKLFQQFIDNNEI